jgi:DNA recombination protein RmuC
MVDEGNAPSRPFGIPNGGRPTAEIPSVPLMEFFLVLIGLVAGAAAVGLVAHRQRRELAGARALLGAARDEAARQRQELAVADARLETLGEDFDRRIAESVRTASTAAYQQANTTLVELAGAKLEGTVSPLKESLVRVGQQVQELESVRARSYGQLTQQLTELGRNTSALTTALRTPHVRGRWGEIQLRRVVELAGMLPYCDFSEQETVHDDDGRSLRPDMIVRLPGERTVVVDAKVPLAAYLDACEAVDEDVRAGHLATHARQLRDHLQRLSQKQYWQQFTDSPDFVVMFLPDEGFFSAAWRQDSELVELGVRSRVHIASPTTLITLLQAFALGWQQEKVAEDARAVQVEGRKLYDSICVMGGHLSTVGKSLDRAVSAYNQTVRSTETRVLPPARKLVQHVVSDKDVPDLDAVTATTIALTASELAAGAQESDQPALEIVARDASAA